MNASDSTTVVCKAVNSIPTGKRHGWGFYVKSKLTTGMLLIYYV